MSRLWICKCGHDDMAHAGSEYSCSSCECRVFEVRNLAREIRDALVRCGPLEHAEQCERHNKGRVGCVWDCVCGCDDLFELLRRGDEPAGADAIVPSTETA